MSKKGEMQLHMNERARWRGEAVEEEEEEEETRQLSDGQCTVAREPVTNCILVWLAIGHFFK